MLNTNLKEASVTSGDVTVSLTREMLENRATGKYQFQVSVRRKPPFEEMDVRSQFVPQVKGGVSVERQIQGLGEACALYLCDKYEEKVDPDQCARDTLAAFNELCKKISSENNLRLVKNTAEIE